MTNHILATNSRLDLDNGLQSLLKTTDGILWHPASEYESGIHGTGLCQILLMENFIDGHDAIFFKLIG